MAALLAARRGLVAGVLAAAAGHGLGERGGLGEPRRGVELVGHVEQQQMGRPIADQRRQHPIMRRALACRARRKRGRRHVRPNVLDLGQVPLAAANFAIFAHIARPARPKVRLKLGQETPKRATAMRRGPGARGRARAGGFETGEGWTMERAGPQPSRRV